jgi:hypothetical protein
VSDNFTKLKLDWLDELVCDPSLSPFAFCVAYVLSTYVNRKSGTAWPKHETIAERIKCSRDGVRKAIRGLLELGYLGLVKGRGRGHSNCYRLQLKKGDSHHPFQTAERVTTVPKKGDGRRRKGVQPSPQNPLKNPLKNPTNADPPAGSLATALPTGALARPPCSEQPEPKTAAQAKNGGAEWLAHIQLNPYAEQQRLDREITAIIGPQYWELPEDRMTKLRDGCGKGNITADELRATFSNGAPAATGTLIGGIGEQSEDAEFAVAARGKRAADCKRAELDAVLAENRARKNVT